MLQRDRSWVRTRSRHLLKRLNGAIYAYRRWWGRNREAFFPGQTRTGPHPLPPSCEVTDLRSEKCLIRYTLEIKVPRAFRNWEDKTLLNFTPCRSESSPASLPKTSMDRTTQHRQFCLSKEGIPQSPTTSKAIGAVFRHRTKIHTVNFSLSAVAPTAIVIGKPYEIVLMLISGDTETRRNVSGFQMKEYSLSLRSRTDVRSPASMRDQGHFLQSLIPLSSGELVTPLGINAPLKFTRMFPLDQTYAAPSFKM